MAEFRRAELTRIEFSLGRLLQREAVSSGNAGEQFNVHENMQIIATMPLPHARVIINMYCPGKQNLHIYVSSFSTIAVREN